MKALLAGALCLAAAVTADAAEPATAPTSAEPLTPTSPAEADDVWKSDFHGYLRAPVRVSWGPETIVVAGANVAEVNNCATDAALDPHCNGARRGAAHQLHTTPRVPGLSYTDWNYTNSAPGPWAELDFSYGNSRASATVVIGAYSLTSGGYRDLQAQQGIDQAFVTVRFPEAFGDLGGLLWRVGAFHDRYGMAGKYDGGMYETYLFGRTRVAGSTLTADLAVADRWKLTLEQGLGAKIEVQAFTNNQVNEIFNVPTPHNDHAQTAKGYGGPYNRDREDLPYQGAVPQGSTFLHHEHVMLSYKSSSTFGLHFLQALTPDDNWSPQNDNIPHTTDALPRARSAQPGSLTIWGGDVRFDAGPWGYGYLGYAHTTAKNILALADAVEVLHSFAGWNFKQNFFGRTYNPHDGGYEGPQNESGSIDTLLAQYTFSVGALVNAPAGFWGQGPDLAVTAYGMLNLVESHDNLAFKTKKLKYGLDVAYVPWAWLSLGVRGDMVQPDLDGAMRDGGVQGEAGSAKSFGVLSPRVVFKTAFVTHEAVTVQYSRYFLGSHAWPTYPYEWAVASDPDMVAISATVWW